MSVFVNRGVFKVSKADEHLYESAKAAVDDIVGSDARLVQHLERHNLLRDLLIYEGANALLTMRLYRPSGKFDTLEAERRKQEVALEEFNKLMEAIDRFSSSQKLSSIVAQDLLKTPKGRLVIRATFIDQEIVYYQRGEWLYSIPKDRNEFESFIPMSLFFLNEVLLLALDQNQSKALDYLHLFVSKLLDYNAEPGSLGKRLSRLKEGQRFYGWLYLSRDYVKKIALARGEGIPEDRLVSLKKHLLEIWQKPRVSIKKNGVLKQYEFVVDNYEDLLDFLNFLSENTDLIDGSCSP